MVTALYYKCMHVAMRRGCTSLTQVGIKQQDGDAQAGALRHCSMTHVCTTVPHNTDEVGVTSLAKVNYPVSEHDAALAHPSREAVSKARRVVIKVGSAVVTRSTDSRLALGRLGALVEQIESLVRSGRQCILVTSGGVCVGRQRLRHQQVLNSSPLELQIAGPALVTSACIVCNLYLYDTLLSGRAAAAAGQSGLMALYDSLFGMMDLQAAQVLVTNNDFNEPAFKANLVATTEELLALNVVPVFNENDAISCSAQQEVCRIMCVPYNDCSCLSTLLTRAFSMCTWWCLVHRASPGRLWSAIQRQRQPGSTPRC